MLRSEYLIPGAVIRVVVPWDVARTGHNRIDRWHWSPKARVHRQAREVARLAWLAAGSPRAAGPVRVSLIVRRARKLDQANIWGACKQLLDGLFVSAITPDDTEQWVRLGGITQETGKQWRGREEVEFVVEEEE